MKDFVQGSTVILLVIVLLVALRPGSKNKGTGETTGTCDMSILCLMVTGAFAI